MDQCCVRSALHSALEARGEAAHPQQRVARPRHGEQHAARDVGRFERACLVDMSPQPPRCMAPHPTTAVPLVTGPYCHGCPIALGGLGAARHALHLRSRTSPLLARSGPAFARHWRVDRPSRPMTGGIRASSEGGRLAQSRGSTFASAAPSPPQHWRVAAPLKAASTWGRRHGRLRTRALSG